MAGPIQFTRRILLVEDEQLTRALVANLLEQQGFEVRTSGSADEAATTALEFDPDALVVDISLGSGPTGIDLMHSLRADNPHLAFVVLSNYAAAPASIKNLQRVAYLQKKSVADPRVLISALESVLVSRGNSEEYPFSSPAQVAALNKNQLAVISMIADGLSNQEIALRRGTTVEATEQLISRIYKKMGLKRTSDRSLRVQASSIYLASLGTRVKI